MKQWRVEVSSPRCLRGSRRRGAPPGTQPSQGCRRYTPTQGSSTIQYGTLQYSIVRYVTVQYGTLQYSIVRYVTVQYSTVRYSTVQYGTLQYSTVRYVTVQYSRYTEQYGTGQCNTVSYCKNATIQQTEQYGTIQSVMAGRSKSFRTTSHRLLFRPQTWNNILPSLIFVPNLGRYYIVF